MVWIRHQIQIVGLDRKRLPSFVRKKARLDQIDRGSLLLVMTTNLPSLDALLSSARRIAFLGAGPKDPPE